MSLKACIQAAKTGVMFGPEEPLCSSGVSGMDLMGWRSTRRMVLMEARGC